MTDRRVLLFSPLSDRDPTSGDTSYTEALVAHPPPGVHYITYQEAIAAGTVRVRGRKPWRNPRDLSDLAIFGLRLIESGLRKCGVLFREPNWFITAQPGAFDLIHQHLFPIRQVGTRLPVVSSAGYPLSELYRFREGWSPNRTRVATAGESIMARLFDVHVPWLHPVGNGVMTVYGEHFRSWLIARGVSADRILIASTALPELERSPLVSNGKTLGFIGRDFLRKGGDIAIGAFRRLHDQDPTWTMIVVTTREHAASSVDAGSGVELIVDPSREVVLREVVPRIDILLCPTRSDCGAPYGILESLQADTCVVTSTIPWLDDRLGPPSVMRVPNTVDSVVAGVQDLVRSGLSEAQSAAHELWKTEFSMSELHADLSRAYDLAIGLAPA